MPNQIIQKTRYYTTAVEDAGAIEAWLDTHVVGAKPRQFYASFVNWCLKVAQRAKNPGMYFQRRWGRNVPACPAPAPQTPSTSMRWLSG